MHTPSWGIFKSPKNPEFVVKLFYEDVDFYTEKTAYDNALRNDYLKQFVNPYTEIRIDLTADAPTHFLIDRKGLPYKKALEFPFLAVTEWKEIGKLEDFGTEKELKGYGVDVNKFKENSDLAELSCWEPTFSKRIYGSDIKIIDITCNRFIKKSDIQD